MCSSHALTILTPSLPTSDGPTSARRPLVEFAQHTGNVFVQLIIFGSSTDCGFGLVFNQNREHLLLARTCRDLRQVTLSILPVHTTSPNFFSLIQHSITASHPPVLSANSAHPPPPCSVQGRSSAGQDLAIIEHVQGSASLATAWRLQSRNLQLLPCCATKLQPGQKKHLTITVQRNSQPSLPHHPSDPEISRNHFPWWRLPATGCDAARLRSSAPASTLPLCRSLTSYSKSSICHS